MKALWVAGQCAAATLATVTARIGPGVTTQSIDQWVRQDTQSRGATPSQLGYQGFPASVCTSVNEVVCHGIPRPEVTLKEGDIINVDVTSCLEGFHGDTSVTVAVGELSQEARTVLEVSREALQVGIRAIEPGSRLGDIGHAIETFVQGHGCDVVRDYGGHGIGRNMHMVPHVHHYGPAGRGPRLRPGMAFTIEPMVTIGRPPLKTLEDGWTVVTGDGTPSAQFEHTVVITQDGPVVTTDQRPTAIGSAMSKKS